MKKIGVIGGGISGLALACRLSNSGNQVTVFERASQAGGLATFQDHGEFVFDRYYHVILPTDQHLISFLGDIGLADQLIWETTLTGFFVDQKHYSLSSAIEFLKFPVLSLYAKCRLAWTILYCSRITDWKRMERIHLKDWLIRHSGRETYAKLWKPLLLAKLGENYERVSAVFIWTYIKRMFSARESSASKEHMGHVRGGYRTVINRLCDLISAHNGSVRLGVTVSRIKSCDGGGIDICLDDRVEHFDKVIFTGPVNVLSALTDDSLVRVENSGANVEYLGVQCMALITKVPVTPFYVLNIADSRIPFTGAIGMSNLMESGETAGLHLTYLPRYILSTSDEMRKPDEVLQQEFKEGLEILFPDLKEDDIVSSVIYRAEKVQPLQVLNFSTLIPSPTTLNADLYVLNTAQFVNNTLNNNEVIRAVNAFVKVYGESIGADEDVRVTE